MKNIIESVLVKHLGKYIDGLKNSLDIGLLDGEVTIENVSLKPSFINELGLPFTLKFSHIERIHINIPWTNLKEKNTVVTVKGIYVLLNISYEQVEEDINPAELLRGMIERIRLQMKKKWTDNGAKEETFAEKNLIRIVDNAVVNINNIHVRMESFKRNWDYSMGVIMDDISSYTVDEYEQRVFYHRSFSKKETNKLFKKILTIQKFTVYLNDHEKIFMCNEHVNDRSYFIRMMSYPFPNREDNSKNNKKKSIEEIRAYPTYEIKPMINITLSVVGSQRFAEDMRYIVDLSVWINTIDMKISDKQLSQLVYCSQHFYEYGLTIIKNGKKGYNFTEDIERFYRALISKIAKDEKITKQQTGQLQSILREVPISVLQAINDEIISTIRFETEMKKISKVTNVEKSKKLMQELLQKKEKQDAMEGVEIFKEVVIQARVDRILVSLNNASLPIASIAVVALFVDVQMNLEGVIVIKVTLGDTIIDAIGEEVTKSSNSSRGQMLSLNVELNKGLKKLHVNLEKKEFFFSESTIIRLIDWISLIKIRPALLNYIEEQLNYSIDTTRIMMKFLFAKGREVVLNIYLPIVSVQLNEQVCLKLDMGRLTGRNGENNANYKFEISSPIDLYTNALLLLQIEQGSSITLIDKTETSAFQQVQIALKPLHVKNVDSFIRSAYSLKGSLFLNKYQQLSLIDSSAEEQLEGEFYLNRLKATLNISIIRTGLRFKAVETEIDASQQRISLLRTRIYKLVSNGRYYIVFKQQVDKMVNIIEANSEKLMLTVFLKLKDCIQQICTAFQWQRYYQQLYTEDISTLEEIQDTNLNNDVLMKLDVALEKLQVDFSPQAHLFLDHIASHITYNQFNTEAALELKKVDFVIEGEKIIYDASFKGSYQYLQSMIIQFEVCKLSYNIQLFSTCSKIIALASQYNILILSLKSQQPRKSYVLEEDEQRLANIKTQQNRTDNINKFLLERKISIETTNIEGEIIGYRNCLSYVKVESLKYRNEPQPQVFADFKGILLFSMVEIPTLTLKYTPNNLQLRVDSVNAQINMAIIIYEVVKGEGSLIIKEVIKALKNRKIAEDEIKQLRKSQPKTDITAPRRQWSVRVEQIRLQLTLTGSLCLGINSKFIELQQGRVSWMNTLFWLNNECISMSDINGILKWSERQIDLCMTNFKFKLNGKELLFLVNQLDKIYRFLKINHFDPIEFVQSEMEHPDEKGRVMANTPHTLNLRIQELEIIYECGSKNPLISIRMKPLFLTTEGNVNTFNFSVWHLNRSLKLYEPIVEPFQIRMVEKKSTNQLELILKQIYVILTEQFVIDTLKEIQLLLEIQNELSRDETNELEETNRQEVDRNKKQMLYQHFEYYQAADFRQNLEYSFVLKITSYLSCKMIVEVACSRGQKQQLLYEQEELKEGEAKSINIAQKTSYNHSYELIERYQKVQMKLCLVSQCYAFRTAFISFLLYDQDNYYIEPVLIIDSNGREISSDLAIKVNYSEGIYLVDVRGKYSIENCMGLPLYFRYSDSYTINRLKLEKGEHVLLPLWVVDFLTFGFEQNDYSHILNLSSEEQKEEGGFFELSFKRKDDSYIHLVIQKEKIMHTVKETPKLNYLKQKSQDEKIIDEFNHIRKTAAKQTKSAQQSLPQKHQGSIFKFKVIPGMLVYNHFNFDITVNKQVVEFDRPTQLHSVLRQEEKQYVRLSLGDHSVHEIYLPEANLPSQINLKLTDENYVTVVVQVRRNKLHQRIIHFYSQVHLIFNVPNLHQPTLITNIYQHNFVMMKLVKNSYNDKVHPAPVLKDKFVFSTYHYLLNLEEKYLSVKLNGYTSNQIILYHSDFDRDLKFRINAEDDTPEFVYAVSYQCRSINLETDEEGRKPEVLECFYTYIMPKYYLINHSEATLVVDGTVLLRGGEKLALNNIKYVDLNVRDQHDFKYIAMNFNTTNSLMFVRGNGENREDGHTSFADQDPDQPAQIDHADELRTITEMTELSSSQKGIPDQLQTLQPNPLEAESTIRAEVLEEIVTSEKGSKKSRRRSSVSIKLKSKMLQNSELQQKEQSVQEQQSTLKYYKHIVRMEDICIFSLSKRICDYNTLSYEINDWNEWLTIKNELNETLLVRVKLQEDIAGICYVAGGQTNRIISGLADEVEVVLIYERQEVILGRFSLAQRLNHNVFLNGCEYSEIIFKENKVKVGRLMLVTCPDKMKDQEVYKVTHSLQLTILKISLSLVFHEDKIRRELLRVNINQLKLMLLQYRNGLYMSHLQFQNVSGLFKRTPFLIIKEFKGYLEGFKGEFIERLTLQFVDTLEITLSDELIVVMIGQLQPFEKLLPSTVQLTHEEVVSQQQEETYHINSLAIKGIEIKLCMRKIISDMNEDKSRLLSKLSFSMVEVEDAYIHLSPIQIEQPLKQKHINGISKMYTMESFVGVASGLNILGNPAQFANQFEAGRNKGGVVPFFRSIVAGTTNSVSKIIGTIGSSVSQLTFDRQFMKHRIHNKNIKAQNFGMGLKIGLREFAHSVKSGITGLVQQPMQGQREQGGLGMLKGTVSGLTGLITKPLTGFIFAASKTIEGINSSTTYLDYKILERQELITRPLYHKFKLVRPYKSEDELAYNILINWYDYSDVQLIGGYLLQNQQGDGIVQILIITCSQLILIDLNLKEVILKLKIEQLMATGKFLEGVVLYFQDLDDQDEVVFRLRNDPAAKENLYWTLKAFISLYTMQLR